jgi:hypothetical protein
VYKRQGLVKVTDYGFRQKQSDAIQAEQATAAAEKLALSRDTREVATEFWYLRALGEKHRTPAQSARYGELRGWYSGVYEPVMDVMQQVDADARPALRARVDEGTKPFVRRVR